MKRVGYVDIFRGIGILCMIIGHVGFWGKFSTFVHAFHMPMFFFVTGYFWKDVKAAEFLGRKIRTLLVPYLFWTMLHFIIWLFIREEGAQSPQQALGHIFWENTTNVPLTGIWFLTALFFAEMIYYLLKKIFRVNMALLVAVMAVALVGCLLPDILGFRLPWALDAAMTGVGFIHSGALLRSMEGSRADLLNLKALPVLCMGAAGIVTVFCNSEVNMRTGQYGIIPLFWFNAIWWILVLWNVCRICDEFREGKIWHLLKAEIEYTGRNSICYLCLNISLISLWQWILSFAGLNDRIGKLIIFAAVMIMIHLIARLTQLKGLGVTTGRM
jgi:fucose 4-O-acetylase-like acetyltransferase